MNLEQRTAIKSAASRAKEGDKEDIGNLGSSRKESERGGEEIKGEPR
jgi:hypothetical protein